MSETQDEPHVHIFYEDGDCDCGMWRSQYIEQLEQDKADLLAALDTAVSILAPPCGESGAQLAYEILDAAIARVKEVQR